MKFSYDQRYYPPAPVIEIRLSLPGDTAEIGPLTALVDTGADATTIPNHYLASLNAPLVDRKWLRSQWGESHLVNIHHLEVVIGDWRIPMVEIVADHRGDEVIVGRNIINAFVIRLDGPQHILDIRA